MDTNQQPRRSTRVVQQTRPRTLTTTRPYVPVSERFDLVSIHEEEEVPGISDERSPQMDFSSSGSRSGRISLTSVKSTASSTTRRLAEAELKSAVAAADLDGEDERLEMEEQFQMEQRRFQMEQEKLKMELETKQKQMELETKQKQMELELKRKENQRHRILNEKKLELEKAKILEEAEMNDNGSQKVSDDEDDDKSSYLDLHRRLENLKGLGVENNSEEIQKKNVTFWTENQSDHHSNQSDNRSTPVVQTSTGDIVHGAETTILAEMTRTLQALTTAVVGQKASHNVSLPSHTSDMKSARQTIGKELSYFDGNPEEWPSFISEFRECTALCGFSDRENLQRLRRSLKGKAKETIQSLLTAPENVNKIIETLEIRFGRSEFVVEVLIEKAKRIPPVREDNIEAILDFATSVQNLSTTAEALKCVNHMANPQLLKDLFGKLPSTWKTDWCVHVQTKELNLTTVKDFADWLSRRSRALSIMSTPKQHYEERSKPKFEKKFEKRFEKREHATPRTVMNIITEEDTSSCLYCGKGKHHLGKCYTFQKLDVDSRWKWVTEQKVCFGCFGKGHQFSKCQKTKECGVDGCTKTHHPSLHQIRYKKQEPKPVKTDEKESKELAMSHSSLRAETTMLIKIVPVILRGPKKSVRTFAVLDECSTVSMLDTDMAKKLGISGPKQTLALQGSGDMTAEEEDSEVVQLKISGVNDNKTWDLDGVKTRRNLCPPLQSFETKRLPAKLKEFFKEINFEELRDAKPTLLIGVDNAHLIISEEVKRGPNNTLALGRTRLGWTVIGKMFTHTNIKNNMAFCHFQKPENSSCDWDTHQLVKEHFKIEELGIKIVEENLSSKEDKRSMQIMDLTTKHVNGSWETGLLWKNDNISMPSSKTSAFRRLMHMERKMDKDPNFRKLYHERINYYLENKYARYLTSEETKDVGPRTWYLPHFGVVNPNKPGKIRFVFDAAAKVGGVSFNDMLLTGPDLLTSLPGCLVKFRQREIAFSGDIKDFFHRIKLRKEDQQSQRFLWRGDDRDRDPDTLIMQVSIFGAVCAPYSCQAAKNRNGMKYEKEYPEAAKAITQRHYMDDYLDSTHTTEEAIRLIKEVIEVSKRGDMEIGKWSCNSQEILQQIPASLRAGGDKELNIGSEMDVERVLGLSWNPNTDTLSFNLKFHKVDKEIVSGDRRPTKREVLKLVMSIFDPLGLLGHYTIQGKILLQDIWRSELGWDDQLTEELDRKWRTWISQLDEIALWKIPRCFATMMLDRKSVQLHIFCDASEKAYATVAYLRTEMTNDEIQTSILMSKARVTPLKPTTIPRLELQAAVVGSRMFTWIKKELEIDIDSTFFWSDSKTVLLWLRSETTRFKKFVGHRVGEILEITDVADWRWISTNDNVADEATRDCKPADLSTPSRWTQGPDFLKLPEADWPKETIHDKKNLSQAIEEDEKELELRKDFVALVDTKAMKNASASADGLGDIKLEVSKCKVPTLPDLDKFKWMKLLRITAYVLRYLNNLRKQKEDSPQLTVKEIWNAEKTWLKKVQLESFPTEIGLMKKWRPIPSFSCLFQLSPYLDEDGILRLKGRITAAPGLEHSTKFPIILHPKHDYTRRLVQHYHEKAGHHGHETILNNLRQKYWILNMRSAVKFAWSSCQLCKNQRAKPEIPEMGQLPPIRLISRVRPFTYTGVDYFGPMEVTIGRRHEKRYGALFTCMTTRAIHLEIAHSLSTDSAIMALQRMINRRGKPKKMYSDNGTNFVGADAEIRKAVAEMDHSRIANELSQLGIDWHFIPPASPHMGGSWERLVKAVKIALKSTLKERAPREETLQTLFTAAEMTVNSRPLTYVSSDPGSPESLTPNHFIFLGSPENSSFGTVNENEKCLSRQWKIAQQLADHFWRRWVREYIPTLIKRSKWHRQGRKIKIGDVVIIMDERNPRDTWPKGRIIATYPGKDGQVRVVDVQTEKNIYKRPVSKIAVLDVLKEDFGMATLGSDTGGKNVDEEGKQFTQCVNRPTEASPKSLPGQQEGKQFTQM